ncbi:MAG: lytic transglycosylase domain-containing protein, partial [Gallionella sp.]
MTLNRSAVALYLASLGCIVGVLFTASANAGAQVYTPLSASVRAVLHHSVSDSKEPKLAFPTEQEANVWLREMSGRLQDRLPDEDYRMDLLKT